MRKEPQLKPINPWFSVVAWAAVGVALAAIPVVFGGPLERLTAIVPGAYLVVGINNYLRGGLPALWSVAEASPENLVAFAKQRESHPEVDAFARACLSRHGYIMGREARKARLYVERKKHSADLAEARDRAYKV